MEQEITLKYLARVYVLFDKKIKKFLINYLSSRAWRLEKYINCTYTYKTKGTKLDYTWVKGICGYNPLNKQFYGIFHSPYDVDDELNFDNMHTPSLVNLFLAVVESKL